MQACAAEAPATAVVMPTVIAIEATMLADGGIEIDPSIPPGHMLSVYYDTQVAGEVFVNMSDSAPDSIESLSLDPWQATSFWAELYEAREGESFEYLGRCELMKDFTFPDAKASELSDVAEKTVMTMYCHGSTDSNRPIGVDN